MSRISSQDETIVDTGQDEEHNSQRLLRALRVAVPVEAPETVAARRSALIAVIQREIEETPARIARQERRRHLLGWGATVAALVLATLGATWGYQHSGGQHPASHPLAHNKSAELSPSEKTTRSSVSSGVSEGNARVVLREGMMEKTHHLVTGQELNLDSGQWLSAELPGATKIEFRPSDLQGGASMELTRLDRLEQSLFVRAGNLFVDVPEGSLERRHVTVVTPDAQVEVKGTQFTVQVAEKESRTRTAVKVNRGRVLVTWLGGSRLLTPGQTWDSSLTETAALPPPEPVSSDPPAPPTRRSSSQGRRASGPPKTASNTSVTLPLPPAPRETSTLATQNRLLEKAVAAQQRKRTEEALQLYEQLLEQFPDSPLRSTAIAERRRLMRQQSNTP